jgi:putative SOS response-associated peptidase YedK
MCGRFTLQTPVPDLVEIFEIDRVHAAPPGPRFNIAPTDPVAVVRRGSDGERELDALRWGLIPSWTRPAQQLPTLINARSESLDERPAFQEPTRSRRCLVLADGFYEWRTEGGRRQPYLVRARQGMPFAFAGLWDRWSGGDGDPIESCTIVTTDANDLLRPVHERMPVIIAAPDVSLWLDPEVRLYAELKPLLEPAPSESVEITPVNPRVNRIQNDDDACIEPLGATIRTAEQWAERAALISADPPPGSSTAPPDQLELL